MQKIPKQVIKERKEKLNNASIKLKEHFVGIDYVIDDIIKNIEMWYLYPNFLTRPTIINMWGMTGSGKTDLIHKLVELLDMSDSFLNIDIGLHHDKTYVSSISSKFLIKNITPDKQSILFIDEFQKFTSRSNESGVRFDDIWKLLSEGQLTDNYERIAFIEQYINDIRYKVHDSFEKELSWLTENNKNVSNAIPKGFTSEQWTFLTGGDGDESLGEKKRPNVSKYMISSLLTILKITQEDIDEIWNMKSMFDSINEFTYTKLLCENAVDRIHYLQILLDSCNPFILLKFYTKKYEEMKISENSKDDADRFIYSKLLIFISGNVDELFHSDNVMISIDELYKKTEDITIDKIKNSLFNIFRPEQVSRLGNTHIIYRSLKREHFKILAEREVNNYIEMIKYKHDIDITKDLSKYDIFKLAEKRGLFPSQGVRPFLSTVTTILSEITLEILVKHSESSNKLLSVFKS